MYFSVFLTQRCNLKTKDIYLRRDEKKYLFGGNKTFTQSLESLDLSIPKKTKTIYNTPINNISMGHNIWFKKYPEAESAFLLDGGLNFRSSRKENHINLHFFVSLCTETTLQLLYILHLNARAILKICTYIFFFNSHYVLTKQVVLSPFHRQKNTIEQLKCVAQSVQILVSRRLARCVSHL